MRERERNTKTPVKLFHICMQIIWAMIAPPIVFHGISICKHCCIWPVWTKIISWSSFDSTSYRLRRRRRHHIIIVLVVVVVVDNNSEFVFLQSPVHRGTDLGCTSLSKCIEAKFKVHYYVFINREFVSEGGGRGGGLFCLICPAHRHRRCRHRRSLYLWTHCDPFALHEPLIQYTRRCALSTHTHKINIVYPKSNRQNF